jgi:hypothetical protein
MNSSLLQNQLEEQFELNSVLDSNLFLNNDEDSSLFLKDKNINKNNLFQDSLFSFEKNDFFKENNYNLMPILNNNTKSDAHEKINTISNINDNDSLINLSPLSMLTTSNSNMMNNLGVKEEDIIFESEQDIKNNNMNNQNENLKDEIFKCEFLENISNGLDENDDNYYYNNKKDKIDLNNPTSLLAAIINLMKEKGPIDIKTIISSLENKKDTFRKANGSKYKQEFNKLIRITLKTPDIFYKIEEGNKYFFIEDKTAYYLKKKRERGMERIFMNLKKKINLIPISIKIQIDKVNLIIKKMEKKYKGDKKYVNVMFCIDMFKSLIKKYLFLVKMDKNNSLYELSVLNEKIIDICHTLEKIEKGELFFKLNENIISKKVNEYNNQNNKNIMFVDGDNNHFNEPPNNL